MSRGVRVRRFGALLVLLVGAAVVAPAAGPARADDGTSVPARLTSLTVTTEPGLLNVNLDWSDVDGATEYWLRWRSVDRGERLSPGVRIRTSETTLAMPHYGTWVVRVQACNGSGCGKPTAKRFTIEPPRPEPNRAPRVDTQAANYEGFVGTGNAPRGVLVTKPFAGIFSDPDGDQLVYFISSVTVPDGRIKYRLGIPPDGQSDVSAAQSSPPLGAVMHVFFEADAGDDWDAMEPPVPEDPVITFQVTAIDPEGLSASVQGSFLVDWEPRSCELTAPSSVSGLGIARAAVIEWTVPGAQDGACEVTGFVVGATDSNGVDWETRVTDPEARKYVLRGLDPGDYRFYVRIEHGTEGTSDEIVTMQQNNVPAACDIVLTAEPYAATQISGRWHNNNSMPNGCVSGPEIEFHFKRTADDYYREYGLFPNWPQQDPDLPSFIVGNLEPYVSYDFKIVAVNAAGEKGDSNVATAMIVSDDPSVTPDANSPRNLRVAVHNDGGAFVDWDAPNAFGAGRTFSAWVVEWKTEDGTVATESVTTQSETSHAISGLIDGTTYIVRVAARTTDAQSNTHEAWSAPAPAVTAWSEPTQVWFTFGTPSPASSRIFLNVRVNKTGESVCSLNADGTISQINCPDGTLVQLAVPGDATARSVNAVVTVDGVETHSSTSEGTAGGPGAPEVWASGGDNELVVGWTTAATGDVVGTLDAYIIQHREGTSGAWTDTVVTDTTARSHTVSVTPSDAQAVTDWQVRVRGRANGDDGDANTSDTARPGFTSEILTVKTHSSYTLVPRVPTVEVAAGDDGTLIVEWEPPEQEDRSRVDAYQVRHRLRGTSAWTDSEVLHPRDTRRICAQNTGVCENPRRYEIAGLTGGSQYDVAVRARNANGWREWVHTSSHNIPNG